jgi:hypothetical protein
LGRAVVVSDGHVGGATEETYRVRWRVAAEDFTDSTGTTAETAKHVVIMVRFRVPGAGTEKQLNFWTVKYNPKAVIDPKAVIEEI